MARSNLTVERLRELLNYEQETGIFTWRVCTSNRAPVGSVAGCLSKTSGYTYIGVLGKLYRAHRLAWFYMTASWPKYDTDHENRKRSDNKFDNLREATRSENMQNQTIVQPFNTHGFFGVTRYRKKWVAQIGVNGKNIYLGVYQTPELAHAAYLAAKRIHHPFSTM